MTGVQTCALPISNFNGVDFFTYVAMGAARSSAPTSVILLVFPVNDAPFAVGDSYLAIVDQELSVAASSGVLENDSDIDSASLTAKIGRAACRERV